MHNTYNASASVTCTPNVDGPLTTDMPDLKTHCALRCQGRNLKAGRVLLTSLLFVPGAHWTKYVVAVGATETTDPWKFPASTSSRTKFMTDVVWAMAPAARAEASNNKCTIMSGKIQSVSLCSVGPSRPGFRRVSLGFGEGERTNGG